LKLNLKTLALCCLFPVVAQSQNLPQTPYISTAWAGQNELTNCEVPKNVRLTRESVYNYISRTYVWRVNRYVQRSADSGFVWMHGGNPDEGKNTAMDVTQAPLQGSNCTARPSGTSVQWMTFQLKTYNYFGSDYSSSGGHIVAGLTWSFNAAKRGSVFYDGIGAAIFKPGAMYAGSPSSIFGERFGLNQAQPASPPFTTVQPADASPSPITMALTDGQTYSVAIHAASTGTAVWITAPDGTQTSTYYGSGRAGTPLPGTAGTGYMFGVLCGSSPDASCQISPTSPLFNSGFRVDFMNIASGWF
jgi:hypothetical protein